MSYVRSSIFGHNGKMDDTENANAGTVFYSFPLPPGETCPQRGRCFDDGWCYAMNGNYNRWSMKKKMQHNLELTKSKDFVEIITGELKRLQLATPALKIYIRWNDAGDIYSKDYFEKLVDIAMHNPDVNFYSYTKSVKLVKDEIADGLIIPENYHIIFSWGGKQDYLIEETDRQARIFSTADDAGDEWKSAAHNDKVAYDNDKVCLPYHGQRKWTHD